MRDLGVEERGRVAGGPGPLAAIATVILVAEAADIVYNAAKAFKEGYEANDKV